MPSQSADTPLIASLPMYDFPELADAHAQLWSGIVHHMGEAGIENIPDHLTRDANYAAPWGAPNLLFSQSCGYPLVTEFADTLQPVMAPHYDAPGCDGKTYSSAIIVHQDNPATDLSDLREKTCAINGWDSQSGMNAMRDAVAPHATNGRFFGKVAVSGGHIASIKLVAERKADIAAIDCVTLAHLSAHHPEAVCNIRTLTFSAPATALPYVTRKSAPSDTIEKIQTAVSAAMKDPSLKDVLKMLLIRTVEPVDASDYQCILDFADRARSVGYPELA